MQMKYNFQDGTDLGRIFKPYQVQILDYLFDRSLNNPDFHTASGEVFRYLIAKNGEKYVSRASVIFFLNHMVEWRIGMEMRYDNDTDEPVKIYQPLMGYDTATGKGGHHRRYFVHFDRKAFYYRLMLTMLWQIREEMEIPVPGDYMHEGYEW